MLALSVVAACGGDDGSGDSSIGDASADTTVTVTATIGTTGGTDSMTGTDSTPTTTGTESNSGPLFDVGNETDGTGDTGEPPPPSCKVVDDMDAIGECEESAPPDSFEPETQWEWTDPVDSWSIVTPLAANLTDDNDDGEIDLCDVPDIVFLGGPSPGGLGSPGHIFVLDGETGSVHFMIQMTLDTSFTPALGDIDNDGIAEIIAAAPGGALVAFEHDGTMIWSMVQNWGGGSGQYSAAAGLADMDNDGDVEIFASNFLTDHNGLAIANLVQPAGNWSATAAADLDGDGDLEIVLGHAAYHHDGSQLWVTNLSPGYPQIADLDADGQPEVLLTNAMGLSLIEHTGAVTYSNLRPTGDPQGGTTWLRPAMIHDIDGDMAPEYAMSSANHYTAYEADASILWSADVSDQSGIAAGTAFDFLGDGTAEAMYADEHNMFAFDVDGSVLMSVPRSSGTLSEYPIVVDVDNDGSAEAIVVSNQYFNMGSPGLRVVRDIDDRWIQARRIWNQHTYHVTNVREDGTIPQFENPHWESLNTFRTNAQIEGGAVCQPEPEG